MVQNDLTTVTSQHSRISHAIKKRPSNDFYVAIFTSSPLTTPQQVSLLKSPIRYIKEGIFLLYS